MKSIQVRKIDLKWQDIASVADMIRMIKENEMSEFEKEYQSLRLEIGDYDRLLGHGDVVDKFKDWQPPKPLVEVPQFVADYIEANKNTLSIFAAFDEIKNYIATDLFSWVFSSIKSQEKFTRAWLDGYTIEKEQLYVLEFPNRTNPYVYYVKSNMITQQCSQIDDAKRFTESEIKAIDERYWAFAVEVEE